jgi:hypothetical protein
VLFESTLANNAAVDAADSETYAGGQAAGKYM